MAKQTKIKGGAESCCVQALIAATRELIDRETDKIKRRQLQDAFSRTFELKLGELVEFTPANKRHLEHIVNSIKARYYDEYQPIVVYTPPPMPARLDVIPQRAPIATGMYEEETAFGPTVVTSFPEALIDYLMAEGEEIERSVAQLKVEPRRFETYFHTRFCPTKFGNILVLGEYGKKVNKRLTMYGMATIEGVKTKELTSEYAVYRNNPREILARSRDFPDNWVLWTRFLLADTRATVFLRVHHNGVPEHDAGIYIKLDPTKPRGFMVCAEKPQS
jgi:hypothetical protein